MTVTLLGMLIAVWATGFMMTTDAFCGAQWVEDLHEGLVYVTLGLIALHVAGVPPEAHFVNREREAELGQEAAAS